MTDVKDTAPARKQNTACDACRSRKVKCNKTPGQDKCQHCLAKGYPCTHFVQQATSEKKRGTNSVRRPKHIGVNGSSTSENGPRASDEADTPTPPPTNGAATNIHAVPLPVRYGIYPTITGATPTYEVLTYLFSPPESGNYLDWGAQAHKLSLDSFKAEFALDLVEVYFQIVHVRQPLVDPNEFRRRLHLSVSPAAASSSSEQPLHPALVATVIAWGAKFTEHPLIDTERQRSQGQCPLARILVDRARELSEALKVHRVASADHIVISLLLEPLQSQTPDDPSGEFFRGSDTFILAYPGLSIGFQGFWLNSAVRHLFDMQYNHKATMLGIENLEFRGTMLFAWWMACLCDAYGAAYYRRKPLIGDDDYDIDFFTVDLVNSSDGIAQAPSSREQLEILGYYQAAHALAIVARSLAQHTFSPRSEAEGMPYQVVITLVQALAQWRNQFLSSVSLPPDLQAENWDFVAAVSACSSDATYHIMWIILFNALDDCGFRELNIKASNGMPHEQYELQMESVLKAVMEEAVYGALRIAGLAALLAQCGYLKLDPAVMHVSIIQAGTLLARLGRPEVRSCVSALEQYRQSYEETGAQVDEMKRTYNLAISGEQTLNFMGVFPRATSGRQHSWTLQYQHNAGNGMFVDIKSPHQHHHVASPTQFEQVKFMASAC